MSDQPPTTETTLVDDGIVPAPAVYDIKHHMRGQDCCVLILLAGEEVTGLGPISLTELDGVCTSVWRIFDASALARIDGKDIELLTTFAAPIGEPRQVRWTGRVAGIGITGRADAVTVTITGARRDWV